MVSLDQNVIDRYLSKTSTSMHVRLSDKLKQDAYAQAKSENRSLNNWVINAMVEKLLNSKK